MSFWSYVLYCDNTNFEYVCVLHLFIKMCVGAHVYMQSSCVEIRPQLVRIDSLLRHVDLGIQTHAIRLGDKNPNC